jgi:hypothetical protein
LTLCLVNNIGTENKRNCAAKRIFHYSILNYFLKFIFWPKQAYFATASKIVTQSIFDSDFFTFIFQVAARAGQACQVELLLVYGADPGAVDKTGKSAADFAKSSGNAGIASRLNNAQFELSDRLSFFLCQKRPEHSSGQHFVIPEVVQDRPEEAKIAKRRLQGLSNAVFEELAIDVYDEVDRRETDAIWAALEGNANKSMIINMPFLPVNPDYGTTRNQGPML